MLAKQLSIRERMGYVKDILGSPARSFVLVGNQKIVQIKEASGIVLILVPIYLIRCRPSHQRPSSIASFISFGVLLLPCFTRYDAQGLSILCAFDCCQFCCFHERNSQVSSTKLP